jgi:hypothetical protein
MSRRIDIRDNATPPAFNDSEMRTAQMISGFANQIQMI